MFIAAMICVQIFLISTTINFYLMDGVAQKMMEESSYTISTKESILYNTLKLVSSISLFGGIGTSIGYVILMLVERL